jgi:hypothetical protein
MKDDMEKQKLSHQANLENMRFEMYQNEKMREEAYN